MKSKEKQSTQSQIGKRTDKLPIKTAKKTGSKGLIKRSANLQKLALSVGDFIRYWGFRRVHGAIWTQLYLSNTALSCTDLTQRLGLSKALISPALDELCSYKLIHEVPGPNEKTKLYQAADNTNQVIKDILQTREKQILNRINQDFSTVKEQEVDSQLINLERLDSLESMILSANLMLELMLAQKDIMDLATGFETEKNYNGRILDDSEGMNS